MRYGIIRVPKERMKELLALTTKRICFKRASDLPDDIRIENITFDPITNSFEVLLSGSGAPLEKVAQGAHIPYIHITVHEIGRDQK